MPKNGMKFFSKVRLQALLLALASLVSPGRAQGAGWLGEDVAKFLLQPVSLMLGQKFEPESAAPASFKRWALSDDSNDDLLGASRQQIIERSGFKFENHYVVSDDGYLTQLIRLLNPLAEPSQLKGPPVMLLQGGISDQTIWIWGSARQHRPEPWPRSPQDGPMRSWNRSLAFTLANNGYDVWLVGTRGSNADNRDHISFQHHQGQLADATPTDSNEIEAGKSDHGQRQLLERIRYWDYSMDEIAQLELPAQIDKVLQVTGAQNVTLVPVSFSGTIAPMTLAEQPAYLDKLHNLVAIAPIVNSWGTNNFWNFFQRTLCKLVPSELGNLIANELVFSDSLRLVADKPLRSRQWRYSVLKAMAITLNGASPRYLTFLEPAVYSNIFLPTSFKQIKHFCQVTTAGRLQKYDYGPLANRKLYGSFGPRRYDTSRLNFGNWLIVSGENDALAPASSISDFIAYSRTKPRAHISLAHYNHLDLLAAFDVDTRVNLPILRFFDDFHLAAAARSDEQESESNQTSR